MRIIQILLAIIVMTQFGCVSGEILQPYNGKDPGNVDFSGTWLLREHDSADSRSIDRAISQTEGARRRSRQISRGKRAGFVHVFLETGELLKISQTPYGFFMSVDRSVVEEFQFGEQRMVNVGEIVGQRVSGWDGEIYIVETLDEHGMKLTEKFSVSADRKILRREIIFRSRKDEEAVIVQLFDNLDLSNDDTKAGTGVETVPAG